MLQKALISIPYIVHSSKLELSKNETKEILTFFQIMKSQNFALNSHFHSHLFPFFCNKVSFCISVLMRKSIFLFQERRVKSSGFQVCDTFECMLELYFDGYRNFGAFID